MFPAAGRNEQKLDPQTRACNHRTTRTEIRGLKEFKAEKSVSLTKNYALYQKSENQDSDLSITEHLRTSVNLSDMTLYTKYFE